MDRWQVPLLADSPRVPTGQLQLPDEEVAAVEDEAVNMGEARATRSDHQERVSVENVIS